MVLLCSALQGITAKLFTIADRSLQLSPTTPPTSFPKDPATPGLHLEQEAPTPNSHVLSAVQGSAAPRGPLIQRPLLSLWALTVPRPYFSQNTQSTLVSLPATCPSPPLDYKPLKDVSSLVLAPQCLEHQKDLGLNPHHWWGHTVGRKLQGEQSSPWKRY